MRPLLPKRRADRPKKTTSFILTVDLLEQLQEIADETEGLPDDEQYSRNAVVQDFLEAAVEEYRRQHGNESRKAKK